jgi:peptidyl-prolyl cis-trans isomerase SurA
MALTESTTTISTGEEATNEDPLAPKAGPSHKTRFSDRQTEPPIKQDQAKLKKAEIKATERPVAADATTVADEKQQGAALGLGGDTVKKPKKPKHVKGEAKERLQEKPKPAPAPAIAPTVNPALGTTPAAVTPAAAPATTTDTK